MLDYTKSFVFNKLRPPSCKCLSLNNLSYSHYNMMYKFNRCREIERCKETIHFMCVYLRSSPGGVSCIAACPAPAFVLNNEL